mmetsp:Transcript_52963/g.60694  ORF Transcript_52963/g.60694 Transcript_52963/m.60694 type:complete len:111 (-) Transcript_52963:608-940(-)
MGRGTRNVRLKVGITGTAKKIRKTMKETMLQPKVWMRCRISFQVAIKPLSRISHYCMFLSKAGRLRLRENNRFFFHEILTTMLVGFIFIFVLSNLFVRKTVINGKNINQS